MTAVEPRTDAKAGMCARCRQGDHSLCMSPIGRCACTGHRHPNRPSARPQEAPVPAAAARPIAAVPDRSEVCGSCQRSEHTNCTRPSCGCPFERHPNRRSAGASATAKKEPLWELVKEDPPEPLAKAKKLTPGERVEPMLATIVEAGDAHEWHRVAVFGTPHAAGRAKWVLEKECPEWEWKSTRDRANRPAVFVRLVEQGGE